MSEPLAIQLKNVSKTYRLFDSQKAQLLALLGFSCFGFGKRSNIREFTALRDISLEVPRGQRLGIIGRNGAGKTTLLKLISGNFSQTSGEIAVKGELQALMSTGLGFHPEFTGRENIQASLQYNGLSVSEYASAIQDIIDFCELGEFIDQPVKTYSLGMLSRLQFACATSIKPDILIVDEVLGAGDAYFSVKSANRMERLTKNGTTLLLVSHSMPQILQFCNRVIWMDAGRIRSDGNTRQVVGEYEVFMENMSARILVQMDGAGKPGNLTKSFRLGVEDCVEMTYPILQDIASENEGGCEGDLGIENLARSNNDISNIEASVQDNGIDNRSISANEQKFVVKLTDGQSVFRWPGEPGPKLLELGLFSYDNRVSRIAEGSNVEFRFTVQNQSPEAISCLYQLTIFSLDNRRVTRIISPVDHFSGAAAEKRVSRIYLEPCLLGAAEYYVNFVILPLGAMDAGVPMLRYDLVSRFCDFEVTRTLDYRESHVFSHPARWESMKG
jgi:lipopolysaccharide transport system ATP-binding protein